MSGLAEELRSEDEAVRSLHGKAREVSSMSGIVAGVCWKSFLLSALHPSQAHIRSHYPND